MEEMKECRLKNTYHLSLLFNLEKQRWVEPENNSHFLIRLLYSKRNLMVPTHKNLLTVSVWQKSELACAQCFIWRRQWHPTPVLLPGESHGRRSLVGCSPWGREESDTTERLPFHFSLSCIGEGNGNPLQCSCLENPRDREPGGLPSMGSHIVGHDWGDWAAAAVFYIFSILKQFKNVNYLPSLYFELKI